MAQTIKLKRSATAGGIPTTSQLALGEVAINTTDGKMYIKKSVGGVETIVDITGGGSSADTILEEFQFTATSNQTTFSGSDDNSETFTYTPNAIQVFLNGILLDYGVDYTATNGTSVVLAETVDANDYLQVFAFKQKISDGSVSVNTFTGNGSTTAFTLSINPGDENNTRVFVDGVYQSKSNYAVSGTTLTFSTAPPTGTAIEVEIGNRNVTLDTTANLDFPDNVKMRLGTGQDLEIFHDGSNSYIKDVGTGDLRIKGTELSLRSDSADEPYINCTENAGVSIFHNNAVKLETIAAGIQVTGDLAISGNIDIADGSYFKGGSAGYRFNDAADSINCLIIRDNGDIHYGTSNDAPWNLTGNITPSAFWDKTNGQQWFAANGTFPLALNRTNGTGVIERFYYNGSVTGDISTTGSGVSYNTSSDYRLKENVDYTWDATTRLKQLKPARFNFIADDTNTLVDGFIAHEVESIVPEAVNGTKDAMQDEEYVITPAVEDSNGNITKEAVKGTRSVIDPQGIDQSKLVPLLVKTIQELEARITALES